MGYTHTFEQKQVVSSEAWARITSDFRKLLENMPKHTSSGGGYYSEQELCLATQGSQALNVSGQEIFFNGCDPRTKDTDEGEDLGHETFCLYRDGRKYRQEWERGRTFPYTFCKTARKPYDLMVCAALILAETHAPDCYRIGSGGTPDEWEPALDFVRGVLGDGYVLPAGVLALEGFTEEFKQEYAQGAR